MTKKESKKIAKALNKALALVKNDRGIRILLPPIHFEVWENFKEVRINLPNHTLLGRFHLLNEQPDFCWEIIILVHRGGHVVMSGNEALSLEDARMAVWSHMLQIYEELGEIA